MADIEAHAERLLALVRDLEQHEDERTRTKILELLEHVDHLHRSCVWRLFELMTELGGKGLVDRVAQDPAVKTLFMLYDLIPVDPLMPIEANVRVAQPSADGFVPLQRVGGRRPSWKVGFAREDLPPGALRGIEIDRVPVLLCALDDQVFAYRNACGRGVLPLHLGTLVGDEINCPWHGCRYEARTGRMIAGAGADLEPFAVSLREGTIYVATNVAAASS
jgi:nitrite reductase/ring-hydroxylating ferredoxin subunit